MSITDELREWINGNTIIHVTELRAIADRIDAEHEEKVSYWQGACYEDGYKEGLEDNEDAMAEHGWVELPVDADGVPFRIGDKVDSDHYEDGTVTAIQYGPMANGAIRELVAVRPHGWDTATWHDPEGYRHHNTPTVEDVLRELVAAYMDTPIDDSNDGEFFAEYAAKLRLAKEEDA